MLTSAFIFAMPLIHVWFGFIWKFDKGYSTLFAIIAKNNHLPTHPVKTH